MVKKAKGTICALVETLDGVVVGWQPLSGIDISGSSVLVTNGITIVAPYSALIGPYKKV